MALEKLHFTSSTGEKVEVPYLGDALSYKKTRQLRKKYKDDLESLQDAFMAECFDAKTIDTIENFSLRDYTAFVEQWGQMGES